MKGCDIKDLMALSIYDLRVVGRSVGVKSPTSMRRDELIKSIMSISNGEQSPVVQTGRGRPVKNLNTTDQIMERLQRKNLEISYMRDVSDAEEGSAKNTNELYRLENPDSELTTRMEKRGGTLNILPEGYGFLRAQISPSPSDIYISNAQIRRFHLRAGDFVSGAVIVEASERKCPAIVKIEKVNGNPSEDAISRPSFESLKPVYPCERYLLANSSDDVLRGIDLLAPIGKGQRGFIAAPPYSGKTTLIKKLSAAIREADENAEVYVLLIDERPEDVTDVVDAVDSEVFSSNLDDSPQQHVAVAKWALELAKRQVEYGRDVVILLDSLTRLESACQMAAKEPNGASNANFTKHFLGCARKIAGGGSLTILATAFVDTGKETDRQIYEEMSRLANLEIRLCAPIPRNALFPAFQISRTRTMHQELLLSESELEKSMKLRNALSSETVENAMNKLSALVDSL